MGLREKQGGWRLPRLAASTTPPPGLNGLRAMFRPPQKRLRIVL